MGTPLQIALFLLVIAPACIQAVEPGDTTELLKNAFDGARKKLSKMDQDIFEQRKTKDTEAKADDGSETATELDAQAAVSARAKIEVDTSRDASAKAIAKAQALDIEANTAVQEANQLKQQAEGARQTKISQQAAATIAADKKKEEAEGALKSIEDVVAQAEVERDRSNSAVSTANAEKQAANAKASVASTKAVAAKKAMATQAAESAKANAMAAKQSSDLANFEDKQANQITKDAVDQAKAIAAKAEKDAKKLGENAKEDATALADAEKRKAKKTLIAEKANIDATSASSAAEAGTVTIKKSMDEATGQIAKAESEGLEAAQKANEARSKADKAKGKMESDEMDADAEIESLKASKRAIDEEADKFDQSTSEAVDIIQSTAGKIRFDANAKIAQANADKETADYGASASEAAGGAAKAAKQKHNMEAAAAMKEADSIVDKTLKTGVDEAEKKKSNSGTGAAEQVAVSSKKAQAEAQSGAASAKKAASKTQKTDALKVLKGAKAEGGVRKIAASVAAQEKISKANQDLKKAEGDSLNAKRAAAVKREAANEAGDTEAGDIAADGSREAAASESTMASEEVAGINEASNKAKQSIEDGARSEVQKLQQRVREEKAKIKYLTEEEVEGNKKIDTLNAEASDTEAGALKAMTEVKRLGTETEQISKHGKLTVAQTNSRAELEAMTIDDIHMQEQTWKQLNPQAKLFMQGIRTKAATKKADESRMSVMRRQADHRKGVELAKAEINVEHQEGLDQMRKEQKPRADGLDDSKADVEVEVEAEEKKLSKCNQETAKWNNQLARLAQERDRLLQAEVHWKARAQRNKAAASTYMNDLMAKSLALQKKVESLEMKMAAAALKLNNIGGKLV